MVIPRFSCPGIVLLTLLLLPMGIVCQEKNLHFETYRAEDGLQNEQIIDILEDSFGFIWLATVDGLVKFDGYDFKQYSFIPDDDSSLPASTVTRLMEDHLGMIWVVAERELCRFDRQTDKFVRFHPIGSPSPPGDAVLSVFEDKDHIVWVGTVKGLLRFNETEGTFSKVANMPGVPEKINLRCLKQDSKGRIWVGGDGLFRLDPRNNKLDKILPDLNKPNLQKWDSSIRVIEEDRSGALWLGTSKNTKIYLPDEDRLSPAPLPDSLVNQSVGDILIDQRQNIWVAFLNKGLFWMDRKNHLTRHFQRSAYLPYGLANDQIHAMMNDRAGNIWIGTITGCQRINTCHVKFPLYQVKPGMEASENFISRIHQTNKGGVWMSTLTGQVFFSPQLGREPKLFQSARNFTYYYSGPDHVVLGIQANLGVHAFDEQSGIWKRIDLGDTINSRTNYVLFEDNRHPYILWIANAAGLCRWDKIAKKRKWYYPSVDIPSVSDLVYNMVQLPDGNILANVGHFSTGTLALFDVASMHFNPLVFDENDPKQVKTVSIRSFALTKNYGVWMATPNGLGNYNLKNGSFRYLTTEDGLPTTSVISALTDDNDNVWAGYDGYLTKYIPSKDSFVSFDVRVEIPGFFSGSCAKGLDGQLFFGSSSGIAAFYPDSIFFDTAQPKVVLTSFKILNHPRHYGTSPELIRKITLTHRENIFSFHFAALNFTNSKNNKYKYKLEGFNEDWVDAGAERSATYTNLSPDDYTFWVIACNSDGTWNEKGLNIQLTILPPWWATRWAYLIYASLFFGAIYLFYRFQLGRKLEHADNLRLKELDAVKTRLYTNITHEFRTPLTVISGMADQIKDDPKNWFAKGVELIKRNSNHLLLLVNQMLDLRKIESGSMPVNMVQADVVMYLRYLLESFHSQAGAKKLDLRFHSTLPEFVMDYDPEKLREIVTNLVSNAIKFTPEGGRIELAVSSPTVRQSPGPQGLTIPSMQTEGLKTADCLFLTVQDTGAGIPPEKLPRIFDRFYQVDDEATRHAEGTGIGLTLTKELVQLLGGSISVESQLGKGATFTVMLPVNRQAPVEEVGYASSGLSVDETTLDAVTPFPTGPLRLAGKARGLAQVLIIEDNPDVVQYLSACLTQDYVLDVAVNGKEGIEKALKAVPDLIISDVMMPEMDGFEVCQTLKTDVRTSHIPIILLTAKADVASKIEGLERGADVYLAKPFNKEELLVRIRKLLELRKSLQQHYLAIAVNKESNKGKDKPAAEQIENDFVQKVRHIVSEHLSQSEFDVPQLSREVAMSRSQLYRKLMALTGYPPTHIIRDIRLDKAKTLLLETELTVAEIAYDTGFTDPGYFTRLFKKEVGTSPTSFRETAV